MLEQNDRKLRISVTFWTRPKAVKLCLLVLALHGRPELEYQVCTTGQHRELFDQLLDVFGVVSNPDLGLMASDQRLSSFLSRVVTALDGYFAFYRPDLVLVQGDTSSVLAATLVAYHLFIKVDRVEAGEERLAGTDSDRITVVLSELLTNLVVCQVMASRINPYEDGRGCPRIPEALTREL